MKYNKADINDTIRVAKLMAIKARKPRYVFATGYGYAIGNQPPPFAVKYYSVNPDGRVLQGAGVT